jgi:hypothetical protein
MTGSCVVVVVFTPTSAGVKTATVTVGTIKITVTATGVAPTYTVSQIAPPSGDVAVGSTSATSYITVTNSGPAAEPPPQVTLGGTDATQFSLPNPHTDIPPDCANLPSLAPMTGSCVVVVAFTPTSTGTKTATVTVGTTEIAVTGTGT